jgi:hypothetical protein
MVKVHAELMRVLAQNLTNSDSKELPPEKQQGAMFQLQGTRILPIKCPERYNKENTQGSVKKDLSMINYSKCKRKGHNASRCMEKSTLKLKQDGITERYHKV